MQQRRRSGVMRMYEKLKTLKDKLQKMKTNRANRQIGQTFHFSPFSRKQKQVLTWWCKESPVHDMDGVIADGAIRSGKTISMSLSFVMWAMSTFTGQNFAMCGKTISTSWTSRTAIRSRQPQSRRCPIILVRSRSLNT